MSSLTDEQLVSAYIERGDERAFSLLVARHQERIFSYLMGMVRDRTVANDLFQETFLRAIQAMNQQRGTYEQQDRWLAWIMRIARNATLDFLRSRKKWQDVGNAADDDDDGPSFWDRLPTDLPEPDERLEYVQLSAELERLVDRLPPEQREVVLLRQQADLTFREIAELTDVSINTALGRMRYALINLRKMIDEEFKPEPEQPQKKKPAPDRKRATA